MTRLFAGAGREEIRFPWGIFPFKEGPDTWTGIHDAPCVRAVIFDNGSRWGLISIETVILESETEEEIRSIAASISGVPESNLWISVTHTTSMPHMFERDHEGSGESNLAFRMKRCIISAAADATKTAAESMQAVSFGFGTGSCTVNTNKSIYTRDGWWIGNGEEYPSDHSVPVIRIDGENGKPFIIIYNYSCEMSVMDKSVMRDGGRHMTADLSGAVSGMIEKAVGNEVTAVFLPGPCSDQGPVYRANRVVRKWNGTYSTVDIRDDGWLLLQLAAERLAEQVLVTAGRISCDNSIAETTLAGKTFRFPGQKLKGLPNPLRQPSKEWISIPDAERTRSVEIFIINDCAVILAAGLSSASVMEIKEKSPFPNTIFAEGIFGRCKPLPTDGIKGMADEEAYDLGTIHAKNSEFAKGSAEMMKEHILEMLRELA